MLDYKLELLQPNFDSKLTDLIIEFEKLRYTELKGTTPPHLLHELRYILHSLESINSSRIEGNQTTVIEYMESQISKSDQNNLNIREILNIEEVILFISKLSSEDIVINRMFVSEIHKRVVAGLTTEGSGTPGVYRNKNIKISQSKHTPPDYSQVSSYMDKLYEFISNNDESKYDPIKIAIAHHYFTWVHPFDNGNGRTVRILTYALLVKYKFITNFRMVNPTATFCSNRGDYYSALSSADSLTQEGKNIWCQYMLGGLIESTQKILMLCDYSLLNKRIIQPTLKKALLRAFISQDEAAILHFLSLKHFAKFSDLSIVLKSKNNSQSYHSRVIAKMLRNDLIVPIKERGRVYTLKLKNKHLMSSLIDSFRAEGLLHID
ncbi:Fic family protein (plasmid) [Candidatus Trichorickettsia mobilis]|uniref:Fic family protein n=1 Tax=Candidatus Trichorickettsia mobilis TaxID=1346319 RepID=A0ABZ0UWB3_9RICK|nr:Fic family protein [Candidatus Trichorickettsia mobilis]WPY01480.1 Fic family protein [Candidatus Trichorickettsia mobilis]